MNPKKGVHGVASALDFLLSFESGCVLVRNEASDSKVGEAVLKARDFIYPSVAKYD
jgi:hypothetical protein